MQAVKKVVAEHRLILSGTPIQNNVNELWALFNFLMPGFLGRETEFNAKFGKAFRAARSSKIGSKEAQAAFIAMEGLHKQVRNTQTICCLPYLHLCPLEPFMFMNARPQLALLREERASHTTWQESFQLLPY